MIYRPLQSMLSRLDPERAHELGLTGLRWSRPLGVARLLAGGVPLLERQLLGLRFPNPVGLAAGLDKNGDCIRGLAALGFGFVEVGTVTPRPQSGNPKPRIFRLAGRRALINRLGFNNKGVDYLVARVAASGYQGILGINIGKNADTPTEQAVDDYLYCMDRVYPYADYITVNLSSPNTKGLRDLQHGGLLDELLASVKAAQLRLSVSWSRYVPLVVKISPDMTDEQTLALARALVAHHIDAVAATNTTLSRYGVNGQRHADQVGGLSGPPLQHRSNEVIRLLADELRGALPIIGIGGVESVEDAVAKLHAGASLIQLYTGLVYRGPGLVGEIVRGLRARERSLGDVPGLADAPY
ncbi:dihydroorotate dehydrogenase [Natronocella acetinitrilica]|uniref:Dihydroorotate dehydrogenase (quinone) n=1 Tax=Natronocella acetinitrilica TaxID=414046 RepID=A0AAE3G9C8_9GAMM|nr:quinone-dependent dihydroorotate dehydrogenase [Natronocella acetinitrilica]MCP1676197.1 dihydroorotate dehydrogenase [Natronocella acetinitrilica]